MKEDRVIRKLEEHDRCFETIDKRFEAMDKRFDHFQKTNDKVHANLVKKLLEHDDRFDEMERKLDQRFDDVLTGQDKIITIIQRLDQERIFTYEKIRRVEDDITEIKKVLKIA